MAYENVTFPCETLLGSLSRKVLGCCEAAEHETIAHV